MFQGFPTNGALVWFQFKGEWHNGKVQELVPSPNITTAEEFPYISIVQYSDGDFDHAPSHFAKAKCGVGTGFRWALCKAQQTDEMPAPVPAPPQPVPPPVSPENVFACMSFESLSTGNR